jgi:hypothetical protein
VKETIDQLYHLPAAHRRYTDTELTSTRTCKNLRAWLEDEVMKDEVIEDEHAKDEL